MDSGSTTSLITHQAAKRLKLSRIKNINMTLRSLNEPNNIETSIYLVKVWNYQTKELENITMKGIDYIGPCKGPSQNTKDRMDDILKPVKMNHKHLTWAI